MTRALLKGQKCNKIVLKCAVDEMMEIVKKVLGSKKDLYLLGDVAQLARALDWQSRGRGFESHLLHK